MSNRVNYYKGHAAQLRSIIHALAIYVLFINVFMPLPKLNIGE